jgi:pimeloyl-ACP methyl ester carboxylesterase
VLTIELKPLVNGDITVSPGEAHGTCMTTNTKSSTATTHQIELADGRTLAVDETGPADGPVVVFLHSSPGSRVFDPDPEATAAAGVRLVTVDRPGYGGSSPLEAVAPSEAAVADDLAEALGRLGIDDAAVTGWSAGGRYALALAARHPDLVRTVALIGTPARHEDVAWLPPEQSEMIPSMREDPVAAVATLQQIFSSMGDDPEAREALLAEGEVDRRQLEEDPQLRARLGVMLDETFRQGFAGVAIDIVATAVVDPGYDVAAIGVPVHLFYAEEDEVVSLEHGQHWAGRLADPHRHDVAETGHLLAATEWADILEAVS